MTVGALGLSMFEIGTAEGAALRLPHSRWDSWSSTRDQRRGGGAKNSQAPERGAQLRPIFATFHDAFSFDSDFNSLIGPGLLTCLLPRAAAMSRKRIPIRRGKNDYPRASEDRPVSETRWRRWKARLMQAAGVGRRPEDWWAYGRSLAPPSREDEARQFLAPARIEQGQTCRVAAAVARAAS